jgi:hypothetical protein
MSRKPAMPNDFEMFYPKPPADLAAEMDFLPEFCHYHDEGCELAPSCLECTFTVCAEDSLVGTPTAARSLRDAAFLKMHFETNISAEKLARRFHIGRATAYRILSAAQKQHGRFSSNIANLLVFVISSSLFLIPALFDTLSDVLSF